MLSNGAGRGQSEKVYSRGKAGKRADLDDQFFRSSAEANYARFLKFSKVEYQYEPKPFVFHGETRGSISYTPDFYLPEKDQYVEFKGWLDGKSKTKLKRMKKHYPEVFAKMIIVKQSLRDNDFGELLKIGFEINQIADFKHIEKFSTLIPGWE